jgi:hypothetical protein
MIMPASCLDATKICDLVALQPTIGIVIAPLPHSVAHGEQLALKLRADFARHQMQAQGYGVGQPNAAVFTGQQQGSSFLAGTH